MKVEVVDCVTGLMSEWLMEQVQYSDLDHVRRLPIRTGIISIARKIAIVSNEN